MRTDRVLRYKWSCFLGIALLILGGGCDKSVKKVVQAPAAAREAPAVTFGDKFYDVSAVGNNVWAIGYFGKLARSGDGGRTWSAQKTGTTVSLLGVSFINDKEGWVVGDAGTIIHTADGGATWEKQNSTIPTEKLFKVQFLNGRLLSGGTPFWGTNIL
jgi:photosystem II stability/assembly factor-like uncharacterized protein